jgi:hypothetical protein
VAVNDLDSYRVKRATPRQVVHFTKNSLAGLTGRRSSLWTANPFAGATPSTAAVPTRATAGALGQQNGGGTALRAYLAEFCSAAPMTLMLCDRLSHQGGLSGTTTTVQTTNLPTAALTRYTSGEGVHACLEVYAQIGTGATTVTVSYTNQAGTAGRTSPLTLIGAIGFREVGRVLDIPLQQGDTGVRSVESVDLTATTSGAGDFGVTLYKPLMHYPLRLEHVLNSFDPLLTHGANLPEIADDACLFWIARLGSAGLFVGQMGFAEDDT